MHLIEGGTFDMGGDKYSSEKPIDEVSVPDFYLCPFQVTQEIYEFIMGKNPSYFKGENRPVETVSWDDTKEFIRKLNEKTKELNIGEFRLPTEAKWEYAAKGGKGKYVHGYKYSGSDDLKQVGWYRENSGRETKPVGLLLPNELGLYDMSGNVWEWCEDDWHRSYKMASDDGSAWIDTPDRGGLRVLRGGGYFDLAVRCRPADRGTYSPDDRNDFIGFRVACSPPV